MIMPFFDDYIGDPLVISLCKWMLIIVLCINLPNAFKYKDKVGTGYALLFVVMLLYCTFYSPQSGDNYSSMANYYAYFEGIDWERLHFERLYFYIMDFIPYGYVYYRFFVWGTACLLCVWLLKKLDIKSQIATLSILAFALPILLYYQRAAFAYVLLYVALLCFLDEKTIFKEISIIRKFHKLIAVFLLICTIPFHSSMPIYVTFLLCAVFVPKNKKGISLLVLGLILFSVSLINNSVSLINYFQEDTIETAMRSIEEDTAIKGQNFFGALSDFLRWLPVRLMCIVGIFHMITQPERHTTFEKVCLVNTFILLVVSFFFQDYSRTIQIKFYNASMMPWTLYIASYFNRYVGTKICTNYAIATVLTFFL